MKNSQKMLANLSTVSDTPATFGILRVTAEFSHWPVLSASVMSEQYLNKLSVGSSLGSTSLFHPPKFESRRCATPHPSLLS